MKSGRVMMSCLRALRRKTLSSEVPQVHSLLSYWKSYQSVPLEGRLSVPHAYSSASMTIVRVTKRVAICLYQCLKLCQAPNS